MPQTDRRQSHHHTPSKCKSAVGCFLDLFLRPKKVYFPEDDTGVCAICGTPIKTPVESYLYGFKLVYICGTLILTALWGVLALSKATMTALDLLLFLIIVPLIDRFLISLVLTIFPWREYDPAEHDIEKAWEHAEKVRKIRKRLVALTCYITSILMLLVLNKSENPFAVFSCMTLMLAFWIILTR